MYPVIADPEASSAYRAQIERDFEQAESGVRLTIEQQPWKNRDEKLAAAFSRGEGPDVVLLMPDQIPQFSAGGAISPVDGALKDSVGTFLPAAMDAVRRNPTPTRSRLLSPPKPPRNSARL
jgi:multiple sugar transport system substrate-binding protein